MSLKEQLYVCTLARCQTITKASEELFITQPALSTYISNLEKYLGVKLFDRTGKQFLLTAIGEEYVSRAEQMLQLQEEFDEILKAHCGSIRRTIRIGVQVRRAITMIPYVTQSFQTLYPNVEIVFKEGLYEELVAMYQTGRIDMLICDDKGDLKDTACVELGHEYVLAMVNLQNPVCAHARQEPGLPFPVLELDALKDEMFILPQKTQSLRKSMDQMFRGRQFRPKRSMEIRNFEAVMAMVDKNQGVGFNCVGYLSTLSHYEQIACFLIGMPPFALRMVLAYHDSIKVDEVFAKLADIVKEAFDLYNTAPQYK